MKSLHHIEQRIFEVDGVRATLSGPVAGHADYWTNRFNGDKTVSEFKTRFAQRYPGVEIDLYDGIGRLAHGNYLLKNLRATHAFGWVRETIDLYHWLIHQQGQDIEALEERLRQAPAAGEAAPAEPDPYEVLGVDRACSDDELTLAFRRKIIRFHPDKLSGLDDAIIAFGNERAQIINRARDRILQERAASRPGKTA